MISMASCFVAGCWGKLLQWCFEPHTRLCDCWNLRTSLCRWCYDTCQLGDDVPWLRTGDGFIASRLCECSGVLLRFGFWRTFTPPIVTLLVCLALCISYGAYVHAKRKQLPLHALLKRERKLVLFFDVILPRFGRILARFHITLFTLIVHTMGLRYLTRRLDKNYIVRINARLGIQVGWDTAALTELCCTISTVLKCPLRAARPTYSSPSRIHHQRRLNTTYVYNPRTNVANRAPPRAPPSGTTTNL